MTDQEAQEAVDLIFVGNLAQRTTESDLKTIFSTIGPVESVKLPHDPRTRKPKHVAYVQYTRQEDVTKAITDLNEAELNGRPMRVSIARPLEERDRQKQAEREAREREYDDYGRDSYRSRSWDYHPEPMYEPRYRDERYDRYEHGYERDDRRYDRYSRDYDRDRPPRRVSNREVIASLSDQLFAVAPRLSPDDLDSLVREVDRIVRKRENDDMYASLRNLK